MAKLPVASALPHLNPTIIFESADEISHGSGHAYSMLAWPPSGKRQRDSAAAGHSPPLHPKKRPGPGAAGAPGPFQVAAVWSRAH